MQVSAATRALEFFALARLEEQLSHSVAEAVARGGHGAQDKVKEGSAAIARSFAPDRGFVRRAAYADRPCLVMG
jgi:hypothetical protein